jgi:hypothetical protein
VGFVVELDARLSSSADFAAAGQPGTVMGAEMCGANAEFHCNPAQAPYLGYQR